MDLGRRNGRSLAVIALCLGVALAVGNEIKGEHRPSGEQITQRGRLIQYDAIAVLEQDEDSAKPVQIGISTIIKSEREQIYAQCSTRRDIRIKKYPNHQMVEPGTIATSISFDYRTFG